MNGCIWEAFDTQTRCILEHGLIHGKEKVLRLLVLTPARGIPGRVHRSP